MRGPLRAVLIVLFVAVCVMACVVVSKASADCRAAGGTYTVKPPGCWGAEDPYP